MTMFGMQDDKQLPICGDIAVDKHQYAVKVSFTDNGSTVAEEIIEAGSVAHAAALVGMLIYAKNAPYLLDTSGDAFQNFAHNMGEHVIVDVQLIS
jgi:hypothetical protein